MLEGDTAAACDILWAAENGFLDKRVPGGGVRGTGGRG